MRNNKSRYHQVVSAQMADPAAKLRRLAQCWGYNDRVRGLPFRNSYETMPSVLQKNYELGRLKAINIMVAGLTPPVWKEKVHTPHDFVKCLAKARDLVGNALPNHSRDMPDNHA